MTLILYRFSLMGGEGQGRNFMTVEVQLLSLLGNSVVSKEKEPMLLDFRL